MLFLNWNIWLFSSADGLSVPSGNCSAGWYCTSGAFSATPTFSDNSTANISQCSCPLANYTGGQCWPGTFCPSGSNYPVDCTAGQYCSIAGLDAPQGLCDAGYVEICIGECQHYISSLKQKPSIWMTNVKYETNYDIHK